MKQLKELYDDIQGHIDDPGPYSHNIISIILRDIANHHGKAVANKAIRDLGLDELGWEEEPVVNIDEVRKIAKEKGTNRLFVTPEGRYLAFRELTEQDCENLAGIAYTDGVIDLCNDYMRNTVLRDVKARDA